MFSWIVLIVLVANIGISGFFRYQARQSGEVIGRREEGGVFVLLRLFLTLPLLLAILAYIINPAWMVWSSLAYPAWLRWGGAVLGVTIIPFTFWVFRTIGRNISETVLTKETHELVTDGPYRWVRHPLYTVGTLMLVSISLMTASWFISGMTVLGIVIIIFVIIPKEEVNLINMFGEAYRMYKRRTGMLLPRPW